MSWKCEMLENWAYLSGFVIIFLDLILVNEKTTTLFKNKSSDQFKLLDILTLGDIYYNDIDFVMCHELRWYLIKWY